MTDYIGEMPAGLDRALLRILSFHRGEANAVSRFTLEMQCAQHGFPESDRKIRACINLLRKAGYPICSKGGEDGGYYMATTRQELDDYITREPQARINDFSEQIKAMRSHYPADNQMSLI